MRYTKSKKHWQKKVLLANEKSESEVYHMKTRKLRLLSALLALAMLLALLPTAAFAAEDNNCGATSADKVTWSLENGTLTISGAGEMADYVDDFSTFKSTAPWANEQVTRVVINEGVTRIGNKAFFALPSITSVSLPDGVKSIGEYAFSGWSLGGDPAPKIEKIKIPASVTDIEDVAFGGCEKLKTISFEADSKLAKIGVGAFCNCSELYEVTIPASVTTIGRQAFARCSDLQSVTFAPGSKLETIGENAFSDCSKLQTISCESALKEKLSGVVDKTKVEIIVTHWNVSFVTDAKTTTTPVENNKKIVDKPADPTRDGWDFAGWYTKDESGKWAAGPFDFDTPITNDMTLYARWTASGTCGANLTWILDDNGTLTISGTGKMADYDDAEKQPWAGQREKKQIQKIVIEDEVTSIGDYAFSEFYDLREITIPENITSIGRFAFAWCKSLSEITIPAKVERIGEYAFYGCYDYNNHSGGLKTVTFAENSRLTTIEEHAFYKCMYLEKIEIPASVTSIGGYAFNSCANLKELAFAPNSQLKSIGEYAFGAVSTDTVSPAYTSVQIPASVTEIGQNAFYHCTELKTVEFEEGSQLKALGDGVFVDCGKLETVELPSGITEIGAGAFANCGSLKEFTIPANVETIGETAFALCKNLEKITIPKSVKKIGQAAFALCPLKTVYYDGTAEEWANIEIDETKIEIDDIDFSNGILKTTTVITSKEDEPAKPTQYPITIDNGTAYIDGEPVTEAKENDVVTIVADETAFDGMAFERWEVRKGEVKLENDHAAKTSFTMPAGEVQLEAMYQAADANDSGWDAATVVTGAVIGTGTAILAYHIGMEVYAEQVLGKGVAVPRTRGEVALLAWQLAGSPAVNVEGKPLSEAAQAQRWAVESGLMQPDAEGNFNGTKKMSKWNALRTLDAAKKMG